MELVNQNQTLEIPQPKTQLERMESWASLSDEDRKRKAAQALVDGDKETLSELLESYLYTFGKKGLRASDNTLKSYRKGLEEVLHYCAQRGIKAFPIRFRWAQLYSNTNRERNRKPES